VLGKLASGLGQKLATTWGPFANATIFRLMSWAFSGSALKSLGEIDRLVDEVLLQPDFDASDLTSFRTTRESQRLDESVPHLSESKGWKADSVFVRLPCDGSRIAEDQAHNFEVPGVHHRKLNNVIIEAFDSDEFLSFNNTPYSEYWKPTETEDPIPVYSKIYSSEAMRQAHAEVQAIPPDPAHPNIETVVACLMLYSDSTSLANFGTASLWPIYLFFGNQSKYTRAKPTEFAAHHLAYIPSVSFWPVFISFVPNYQSL
jgi:hypothetical protein